MDEATRAHVRLNVTGVSSTDSAADCLQCNRHVPEVLAVSASRVVHWMGMIELATVNERFNNFTGLLIVEDATFLVDLDHRCTRVVVDHAALPIMINSALLLERNISLFDLWHRVLVPDRDVWVNDGITCIYTQNTVRVVSLRLLIDVETPSLRLVTLVAHTIVLLVLFEDTLTVRSGVCLTHACHRLVVAARNELKSLQLLNGVSVTISLTVYIQEPFGIHLGLDHGALWHTSDAAGDGGGVTAPGGGNGAESGRNDIGLRSRAVTTMTARRLLLARVVVLERFLILGRMKLLI